MMKAKYDFKKKQISSNIKRHPNKVMPGDILVCDHTENIDLNTDLIHCAMYLGNNFYIESLPMYGVKKLHKFRRPWIWNDYKFYYVKKLYDSKYDYNAKKIIDEAIKWSLKQESSRYQYWHDYWYGKDRDRTSNYDPDDQTDKNSHKWICSELLWAAYMNASKEIGLEKDNWINIANSKHIEGSKYEFVSVYNLINKNGELEYFKPINPPIPKVIQNYVY